MAHYLVTGRTASGKSNWAKCMIRSMRSRGIKVLLLDPLRDPSYEADFRTTEPGEFMKMAFHPESKKCLLVVDEAGMSIGRYNPEMERLATMSRHFGHQSIFVTQSVVQISPIVRNNCENLVMFATGPQAAKMMSEQFGRPEIMETLNFGKGEYLFVPSFGNCGRGNVFDDMKKLGLFRG